MEKSTEWCFPTRERDLTVFHIVYYFVILCCVILFDIVTYYAACLRPDYSFVCWFLVYSSLSFTCLFGSECHVMSLSKISKDRRIHRRLEKKLTSSDV